MTTPNDRTDDLVRSMREDLERVTAMVWLLMIRQELADFRNEFRAELHKAFEVLRQKTDSGTPEQDSSEDGTR